MKLALAEHTFVIAEMANSHEGNLSTAKKIVEKASFAGVDAMKFQKFTADELAEPDHENYHLYQKLEMSNKKWQNLVAFTKSKKLKVFFDVFGVRSARDVLQLNIDGIKIHSADLSNPHLLKSISNFDKTILISTAGSFPDEIHEALNILKKNSKEIILMHGFQAYPTSIHDINLARIKVLQHNFRLPVGIMDHISGESKLSLIIPLLAVALGAVVVEKHITLDRSKKGLDYYSALEPNEFKMLITLLRQAESSFGSPTLKIGKNEMKYRLDHKKNTIAKEFIRKNTLLTENLFENKRTKMKKDSVAFFKYKGEFASQNIPKKSIITSSMITHKIKKVVSVIACRVESSRLFAKPFHLIDKQKYSILDLLIEQIKQSKLISDIVLAISENEGNEYFIKFAKENNLKFILGNDRDVLKRLIEGGIFVNADIVFRITPENPYIYWEGIDSVIRKHIDGKYDFSIVENIPLGSGFEIINLDALKKSHKLGSKRHRSELCSLYIYENQKKFKINLFVPEKSLQRPEIRLTVDNPEDLLVVMKIYEKLGKGKKPIPLKHVIEFLDKHPEISHFNSHIPPGKSRIW